MTGFTCRPCHATGEDGRHYSISWIHLYTVNIIRTIFSSDVHCFVVYVVAKKASNLPGGRPNYFPRRLRGDHEALLTYT